MNQKSYHELNMLIAEKVMGWKKVPLPSTENYYDPDWAWDKWDGVNSKTAQYVSPYCISLEFAWEVVDKMLSDGWRMEMVTSEYGGTDVAFICNAGARGTYCSDETLTFTPPMAICLAAEKAVEAWPMSDTIREIVKE